ncbi:MAG: UV DNA damage repair endonuclease UvsE [Gemmatimonadota bacterium]|nr:UV DNA damage repair endonuclease UvsE [Gemmatimonadota bacterium]
MRKSIRPVVRSPASAGATTPRLGLCCQFVDASIHFRRATHRHVSSLDTVAAREYLTGILQDNSAALIAAVQHCSDIGIGAFRINSQILPLATHPVSGYEIAELDGTGDIRSAFRSAGALASELDIRLSFHPDQFVVLNSERPDVVSASVEEMRKQAEVAQLVGADVLTLHAGSSAGGIPAALERLERGIEALAPAARARVALENDDRRFAPASLLPLCERLFVPLVYDVHHHRCNPDQLDIAEATRLAEATWKGREPHFHISSPRSGWGGGDKRPHADYVTPDDFPDAWRDRRMTIDVEAKAKERAVLSLREALAGVAARR